MEGGNPNVDSSDVQARSAGESDKLPNNNRVGLRADASLGPITVGPRRISKRTVIKQRTEKVTETGTTEQKERKEGTNTTSSPQMKRMGERRNQKAEPVGSMLYEEEGHLGFSRHGRRPDNRWMVSVAATTKVSLSQHKDI